MQLHLNFEFMQLEKSKLKIITNIFRCHKELYVSGWNKYTQI